MVAMPMAAKLARITPFFHYPPEIRRAIHTTNSVESLNRSLRKIIITRGADSPTKKPR